MENFNEVYGDSKTIMSNMLNNASKLWGSMSSMDNSGFDMPDMKLQGDAFSGEKVYEAWKPAYDTWQDFAKKVNKKDIFESMSNGGKGGSDNFQKIFQSGFDGYSFFTKKWMESAENIENIFKNNTSDGNGKGDIFKIFNDIYQKEFSKFFAIPSLGLSREYQQKMQRMLDKGNVFSGALMEFMYFLYIPFEKSFQVVQDSLAKMAEDGSLPEDQNAYYEMWITQLESHYLSLFKSTEYLDALGNVVAAMSDFKGAQQLIVQDYLKVFGVPVESDMDELYKDIYTLKKRLRKMEKEMAMKS